jgi:hypothetical protein
MRERERGSERQREGEREREECVVVLILWVGKWLRRRYNNGCD